MSTSTLARSLGLQALIANSGERVSFNRAGKAPVPISVLINRATSKVKDTVSTGGEVPNFKLLGYTQVEVLHSEVPAQPAPGDWFKDSIGFLHRARYVTHTDISWICYCEKSQQ